MAWTFGSDDEDDYGRARNELLERFAATADGVEHVDDASLLLGWKFGYGDGDLVTWTTADLDEVLLDWAPRKVSAPPSVCRPMISAFQRFLAFLATERLLGVGSSPWRTLDEHLTKLTAPFERAMGDSSRFGMAKSLFSAMGAVDEEPDAASLQRLMQAFNDLPIDERGRILGLSSSSGDPWIDALADVPLPPGEPRDEEALRRFVAEAPFFRGVETIRTFVGAGRKLTATGNLNVADTKALAALVVPEMFTGDRAPNIRSADDVPLLQFMLRFVRMAGATRVAKGVLSATASWGKKDPVERVASAVLRVLDEGPVQLGLGQRAWTNPLVDELVDDGVPHLLALLWANDELLADEFVEIAVETARDELGGYAWARGEHFPIIVSGSVNRLLRVLGSLGLVIQYSGGEGYGTVSDGRGVDGNAAYVDEPVVLDDVAAGGVLALTDFAMAILPAYLRDHGYEVPEVGEMVGRPLPALFEHVGEWHVGRIEAEFRAWVAAEEPASIVDQLAEVADSRDPMWRIGAAQLATQLAGDLVERALRRLLDTRSAGHAAAALLDRGADDVSIAREAQMLAGVDLFSQYIDSGDPDDTGELLAMLAAIDDVEQFIDDVWRVREPHAGDLLAAIGRTHPDKRIAKHARKAVVRHRTHLANLGPS